jgi:gamma-glutamylcyclotransferase (GGCT)/AIG2-like uncharacterized protein YtfP
MPTTKLFSYGRLKHDIEPPDTLTSWRTAQIKGVLWDRGGDPGLVFAGTEGAPWVRGELLTIDESELASLDKTEAPEFVRMRAPIDAGEAWVYVWAQPLPHDVVRLLREWRPSPKEAREEGRPGEDRDRGANARLARRKSRAGRTRDRAVEMIAGAISVTTSTKK